MSNEEAQALQAAEKRAKVQRVDHKKEHYVKQCGILEVRLHQREARIAELERRIIKMQSRGFWARLRNQRAREVT